MIGCDNENVSFFSQELLFHLHCTSLSVPLNGFIFPASDFRQSQKENGTYRNKVFVLLFIWFC